METATALPTNSLILPENTTDATAAETLGNSTTVIYDDKIHPELSASFMIVYFIIRMLFSGLALFGNTLTIVTVFRYERLQTATNFLICSLAVSDMLGGTLTPLNICHHLLSDKLIFIPLCLIDKTISVIVLGTNLFSIMWIAIDRYFFIAHPLHYPMWVTRTRVFIVIGLTYTIVTIEIIAIFIIFNRLELGMTCKFPVFLTTLAYGKIIMPQAAIMAALTVAFYIGIAKIAKKQGQAIAALNQPYDTYEAAINRQHRKIAKMMITILGTYFACFVPQVIVSVILKYSTTIFWLQIEKFTVLIYWANTWLNPIIYAWKNEDFRVCFRKLLRANQSNSVHIVT